MTPPSISMSLPVTKAPSETAGQAHAAIDPLSLPGVKEAVSRATFEVMVGFQLNDDQLKYNVTH